MVNDSSKINFRILIKILVITAIIFSCFYFFVFKGDLEVIGVIAMGLIWTIIFSVFLYCVKPDSFKDKSVKIKLQMLVIKKIKT